MMGTFPHPAQHAFFMPHLDVGAEAGDKATEEGTLCLMTL